MTGAVFDCQHCHAPAEVTRDGTSTLAVVRHDVDCTTLTEVVRRRWQDDADRLPETPPSVPFARLAATVAEQRALAARRRRKARTSLYIEAGA